MLETLIMALGKEQGPVFLLGAIILSLVLYAYRMLWKEHIKQREEHITGYKELVQQMFQVVNKNTEVNTKLHESVRELSNNLRK